MVRRAAGDGNVDMFSAYLQGLADAKSWKAETREKLHEAVANNPYQVWVDVNQELIGRTGLDSRQERLERGGTTDRIGRGPVIHNMHNAAWGAIFGANGLPNVSEARLVDVVMQAGRTRDDAFQPKVSTWTTSSGKEVTGPVFDWARWDGKKWVEDDAAAKE
jgi:hypothetical protein